MLPVIIPVKFSECKKSKPFIENGVTFVPIQDAFWEYIWCDYDLEFLYGGFGGGKSKVAVLKHLFRLLYDEYYVGMFCRKNFVDIRKSLKANLKSWVNVLGLNDVVKITHLGVTTSINKNCIYWVGLNDSQNVASIEEASAFLIEEGSEININDYNETLTRLRTKRAKQLCGTVLFNPRRRALWLKPVISDAEKSPFQAVYARCTTFRDNPFIDHEPYEVKLASLPPHMRDMALNGGWELEQNDNKWLWAWNEDKNVKDVLPNDAYPFGVSVDYNYGKFCVLLFQCSVSDKQPNSFIHIFDEIVLTKGALVSDMVAAIHQRYPNKTFILTGDQSGANNSVTGNPQAEMQKGLNVNIQNMYFGRFKPQLMKAANPTHKISYFHCNNTIQKHPNFYVNPRCKELLADIALGQIKQGGEVLYTLQKGDGDGAMAMNAFDALRYIINAFCPSFGAGTNQFILKAAQ